VYLAFDHALHVYERSCKGGVKTLQSGKRRVDKKTFVAFLHRFVAYREQPVCVVVAVYAPGVSGYTLARPRLFYTFCWHPVIQKFSRIFPRAEEAERVYPRQWRKGHRYVPEAFVLKPIQRGPAPVVLLNHPSNNLL
jgi:hypothetical protein